MAGANRKPSSGLKTELLKHGEKFSFFQAIRLLRLLDRSKDRRLRIRPHLSLGFPASDVTKIQEQADGFLVTSSFLGLYGASSPLPTFYTEDIFNDIRDDSTAVRDFLDIIHQRLFTLLIECWKRNRFFIQIFEEDHQRFFGILFALAGLVSSGDEDDETFSLIRYTGLFGRHPISAMGLETVLTDVMGGNIPVKIIQWVPRSVKIPRQGQLRVGVEENVLGVNGFLGQEVTDYQGKFRVQLGPLNANRFLSLMHGTEKKKLTRIIERSLSEPLEYDFEFILSGDQIKPARLGGPQWSSLGLDTTVFTGEFPGNLNVIFPSEMIH